jgi:hypothetical protein
MLPDDGRGAGSSIHHPTHIMDGTQVAGIASLLHSFGDVMILFTYFERAAFSSVDVKLPMMCLELLRLRVSRWGAAIGPSDEVADLKELHANVRKQDVSAAKNVLVRMGHRFEDFAKTTTDQDLEGGASDAPGSDSSNRKIVTDNLRSLSEPRRCKPRTLQKAKWNLFLQKLLHKSFRRQCKLCSSDVKWIMSEKQHIVSLVNDLHEWVKDLETHIPVSLEKTTMLCNNEARRLKELPLILSSLPPEATRKVNLHFCRQSSEENTALVRVGPGPTVSEARILDSLDPATSSDD